MNIYISKRYQLSQADEAKINAANGVVHYYDKEITDLSQVNILADYPERINNFPFQFPNLKFVQVLSAGYDRLDVDKFKAEGIILSNGRGLHSAPIAEYVLGYILATYKQFDALKENQIKSTWHRDYNIATLTNKTLLVLGTGSIGQEIAKRATAFDLKVVGVSYSGALKSHFAECYPISKLDEILPEADIVVGALPSNPDTYHLLNLARFKLMKDQAVLINVGRGDLINTDDLMLVLKDKFEKVILDVFEKEPLASDHPLWQHEKVIVTPHISFAAQNTDDNIKKLIVDNVVAFLKDKPLINLI